MGEPLELGQLVCVVWDDATFGLDDPVPIQEMETVGWITDYHTLWVEIACERTGQDSYRGYTTIPASVIRFVVPLGETD